MRAYESYDNYSERVAAYLRVASLAVAAYDYLWTIPVELQMYAEQQSFFRMGRGCLLFILIRYTSMAALVAGNVGYFGDDFTPSQCRHYLYLAPTLKCIQMGVAHTILFVRTWAISRQSIKIFWTLACLFVVCVVLEFWSSLYKRVPAQGYTGHCTSGNDPGSKVAWVYYLTSTVFDLACLVISTMYLWLQSTRTSTLHGLSRSLMREGMLFFAVLLAINMVNLVIFFKASVESESAAASLGYMVTWIMAQRILIQLHQLRPRACSSAASARVDQTHGMHALRFHTETSGGSARASAEAGVHVSVHVEEHHEEHVNADIVAKWNAAARDSRGRVDSAQKPDAEALARSQTARVVLKI